MFGRSVECKGCKRWHGKKYSKWGLCCCYCKVAVPRLTRMTSPLSLKEFSIPFDPHDMKYFYSDKRVDKELLKCTIPGGVKRVVQKEQDIRFITDKDGIIIGERISNQNIVYFYTNKEFRCELYERRAND